MRSAVPCLALALLAGCTFRDAQVRERAALDFGCPEDWVAVESAPNGYLACGCEKEAEYRVDDGRVSRRSEVVKAPPCRPELPIDRIPGTNSIGID
jgi:hypothetical protein